MKFEELNKQLQEAAREILVYINFSVYEID